MLNILRDYQIVLHCGWATLHSHVHCTGVPILHIFVNSCHPHPLKKKNSSHPSDCEVLSPGLGLYFPKD